MLNDLTEATRRWTEKLVQILVAGAVFTAVTLNLQRVSV